MVPLTIGIRYCGGCNPHYERVEMVRRVQSRAGDRFLFVRHDQQVLDGLIVVNGCPRACGAQAFVKGEVPYYSIADEGDGKGLVQWLFTLQQKG